MIPKRSHASVIYEQHPRGEDPSTLNGIEASSGEFYVAVAFVYALGLFGPDAPLLTQGKAGRRCEIQGLI